MRALRGLKWKTKCTSWKGLYVTAAMLVYRTIPKGVYWEFDYIVIQNLSDILPLLYINMAVSSRKWKRRIDVVGSGIYLIVTVFMIKWRPIGIVVLCGFIIPGRYLRAPHIGYFNGTSCEDYCEWFSHVLSFQQQYHFDTCAVIL